ncbi:MAG: pyridoxamine 5'-phosphate oxidase [Alphaproteobacteria bacterium]|nr:pyridoxamine 5'-phosphate oxidase [Alphaproteobacteria bacterium]USO07425.1 MAG: pyridoxamine 5'-phosphate oxidase [Rhodospirillales bacterium]
MTFLKPADNCDPVALFHQWFDDAQKTEINDPDAACLATADAQGRPSARMVLVRQVDARGFVFFTNGHSIKGRQMMENPHAALCYHWKSLRRSVRVEGHVETIAEAESDSYFTGRPRGSRIGAWASQQSEPLESREALVARVAALTAEYGENADVPRPPHWHGYRIVSTRIEFWQDGEFRLHDRFAFTRMAEQDRWTIQRLYP